jgi:hypothetical protein
MEAIAIFILIDVLAIVSVIYFTIQDRKEAKKSIKQNNQ